TLKSFANAFQQYVSTARVIPDKTSWSTAIASTMGINTNDVLYNPRQISHAQQRVFLIDPNLQVGSGGGLPYLQTNFVSGSAGTPMRPVSPRVMIVSILGGRLPAMVANGGVFGPGQTYFDNLWNTPDGTVPADLA